MKLDRNRLILSLVSLMVCLHAAWAQDQKPDFSGTWKLDKEKSDVGTEERNGRSRGGCLTL
jgi:hypothetical protein